MIGNGQSISLSNSKIAPFPKFTFYDHVRAQHDLLTKLLDIIHLRAVIDWSMGAARTFQRLTQYPDFMDVIIPFSGSTRTSLHNQVFLEGVKSALLAAKGVSSAGGQARSGGGCRGGSPILDRSGENGSLKAFARGYAGWRFSQVFYRHNLPADCWILARIDPWKPAAWERATRFQPESVRGGCWSPALILLIAGSSIGLI